MGHRDSGTSERGRRLIETPAETWRYRGDKGNPYQIEHDRLFEAIRNDLPFNEAENGAISTMTAIMGRMATYSGQMVTWDDALQSELDLSPERYAFDATPPVLPGEDGLYPCAMPGSTKLGSSYWGQI
jgi:myo-inositol 2-dehydrogenase / D-chiro-inositol 1-dehydrogenase